MVRGLPSSSSIVTDLEGTSPLRLCCMSLMHRHTNLPPNLPFCASFALASYHWFLAPRTAWRQALLALRNLERSSAHLVASHLVYMLFLCLRVGFKASALSLNQSGCHLSAVPSMLSAELVSAPLMAPHFISALPPDGHSAVTLSIT